MINVSDNFSDLYRPYKALLIYNLSTGQTVNPYQRQENPPVYVESYDIGRNGNPINAHPLTLKESVGLAELLQSSSEMQNGFLKSKGLLPGNLLYVNPDCSGHAVWYTPPQQRELFFISKLGIPSGKAQVPAMIWKASRESLSVFALKGKAKPNGSTPLYHAPYFNIYQNGNVCMGNVNIQIDRHTHLENFMAQWEAYFFGSYFSHTLNGGSQCGKNIVQLWQEQAAIKNRFPEEYLVKNGLTLSQIIR